MLFFQVGLLIGYSYAHVISKYLATKKQIILHFVLLGLSLLLLPITPTEALKPDNVDSPAIDIILLLLSTVGIPYILVSSTGPLLQQWFNKKYPDKSPYRLYSLSNIGSLLALLSYPFIIEPNLGLNTQTIFWSVGYGVFILACGWAGITLYKSVSNLPPTLTKTEPTETKEMSLLDPPLWIAFSACGSILLLAATNFVCQDVAVIPFFWILPLSLYLITFIIAFDSPRWYMRWFWIPALILITPKIFTLLEGHYVLDDAELMEQIIVYLGGMFLAVMVCHGEMVRIKPPAKHLTFFYLMVSLGGAIGGVFVTFVAPEIFSDFWEWPIGLVLALLLAGISIVRKPGFDVPKLISAKFSDPKFAKWVISPTCVVIVLVGGAMYFGVKITDFHDNFSEDVLTSNRNFYGVIRVIESSKGKSRHRYKMYHGQINHGIQFQKAKLKREPTTYFSIHSGIGLAVRRHPKRLNKQGLHLGVIGLGSGTIGTYLKPKDKFVFYEIDPDVERIARQYFTYLNDGGKRIEVVLGDGRISMERELKEQGSRKFDIFAVDAFSGDAIPIHLLTREAFELYFQHLNKDGVLAVHISNKYVDLEPLLYNIAKEFNIDSVLVEEDRNRSKGVKGSTWVLISNNKKFMKHPRVLAYIEPWPDFAKQEKTIWTDDYSNLVEFLD
ncbi:fused MFS/spermidine synthase [Candidatus Halobeggiatoa sp. HSG11]|nr:fused MFS/spermidine synthase [Candidatus Halobeggiatoa sp. HSG11]